MKIRDFPPFYLVDTCPYILMKPSAAVLGLSWVLHKYLCAFFTKLCCELFEKEQSESVFSVEFSRGSL